MPGWRHFVLCIALASAGCAEPTADATLPDGRFRIDLTGITVSGFSSGGYMANQLHVALSGAFSGAAIIAAGPYNCADGSLERALGSCMKSEVRLDPTASIAQARSFAERGEIDPVARLAIDRVWLFHGANDELIDFPVVDALLAFYKAFVVPSHIETVIHVPAAHVMPTDRIAGPCDKSEPPFIGQCNYDAAGEIFRHFYSELSARNEAAGELRIIDQTAAASAAGSRGLADAGYLFVPESCANGDMCRLHVALHGCEMGSDTIGDKFARDAGYNGWAASNRIIVFYPQIRKTTEPLNPAGCWDWWGYEGDNYARKNGPQIAAIWQMLDDMIQR